MNDITQAWNANDAINNVLLEHLTPAMLETGTPGGGLHRGATPRAHGRMLEELGHGTRVQPLERLTRFVQQLRSRHGRVRR